MAAWRAVEVGCRMVALAWLFAVLSGCTSLLQQPAGARLVVFGDSNADNGNLYRLSGGFIPSGPRWKGRESDGPVAVEYLAGSLGLPLLDFAVSGATTGTENVLASILPGLTHVARTGVEGQIGTFLEKERFRPDDIVILWAGSNDFASLNGGFGNLLDERLSQTSLNLERAIHRVVANGARTLVVVNRLPRVNLDSGDNQNGRRMNEVIARVVVRTQEMLPARIMLFDAYSRVAEMMRDPVRFGFTEVSKACLDTPGCAYAREKGNGAVAGFVHWDIYHKTTKVHRLLADGLMSLLGRAN
jgi:cholinesterase